MSAVLKDGLVLPPGEKSEEEYRAKIARGEVQHLMFAHRVYTSEPAGEIEWAGGIWVDGKFVRETADKW